MCVLVCVLVQMEVQFTRVQSGQTVPVKCWPHLKITHNLVALRLQVVNAAPPSTVCLPPVLQVSKVPQTQWLHCVGCFRISQASLTGLAVHPSSAPLP